MRDSSAILVLAALCLLAESALAQPYYADVTFDVGGDGSAAVTGRTNHPSLASGVTDSLTSKRGSFWLFNLTLPGDDVFSDYFFDVKLPDGASMNYAKTSGQFRITTEDGRISVRGTGGGGPMRVLVQYQLKQDAKAQEPAAQGADYTAYYILGGLLAAAVVLILAVKRSGGKAPPSADASEAVSYDPGMLTDRQKAIMDLLRAEGRAVNQTLVCERLNLPKASVSRNVDSLERMGLITKTRNGMSTMLSVR